MNQAIIDKTALIKEKMIKAAFLGSLALTLTGCGSYSNKFDCPYGEGLGCASVSKVNKMLDENMVEIEDKLPSVPSAQLQQQIPIYYGPMRPSQIMTFKGIPVI